MARWLCSTNHKDIGTLYLFFGLFAGLIGIIFIFFFIIYFHINIFIILINIIFKLILFLHICILIYVYYYLCLSLYYDITIWRDFIWLNFWIMLTLIIYIFSYFTQLHLLNLHITDFNLFKPNIAEAAELWKYGGIYKWNWRSNWAINQVLFPNYDNETTIYKIFDDANKISIKTLGKEDLSFKISENELYQKAHILFILAKIASHQLPVIDGINMGHIAFSPLPQASQNIKIFDIAKDVSPINIDLFLDNINKNSNIFIEKSSLVLAYKADGLFYDSITGKILGSVQLKNFYNTLDQNLIPKIENALCNYKDEADLLIVNLNLSDNSKGRVEYLVKQLNELNKFSQIPLIFSDCSYIHNLKINDPVLIKEYQRLIYDSNYIAIHNKEFLHAFVSGEIIAIKDNNGFINLITSNSDYLERFIENIDIDEKTKDQIELEIKYKKLLMRNFIDFEFNPLNNQSVGFNQEDSVNNSEFYNLLKWKDKE